MSKPVPIVEKEIAVYRGYELLAEGKLGDCAKKLKIGPKTLNFYLTPAYQRRLAKRKDLDNSRTVVRLDVDD